MSSRILVLGACNAWGAWDSELHGWVNRLALRLEKKKKPYCEVYNSGVSGDSADEIAKRMESTCKAVLTGRETEKYFPKEKNIILMEIDRQDAALFNGKPLLPPNRFDKNLSRVLRIANKYAGKIAFVMCTNQIDETKTKPVKWNKAMAYTNSRNKNYFNKLRRFCEKNKVLLIEIKKRLSKKELCSDGLHLNARGHAIVADAVEKALAKARLIS